MKLELPYIAVGGAAVALVALIIFVKKNGGIAGAGAAVGTGVVDAAAGVVQGVTYGIGDQLGVPRTNETECQRALREGRMWDASFACPAGDFIAGGWQRLWD